ncbi:MAG: methylmalonyl-CoA epimerase [Calditrichaeota bacterium]|nr:MAG: methylmalonyl-CoA epimerase [Calditrichota bacterium]
MSSLLDKIDHLGIAVKSVSEGYRVFPLAFGLKPHKFEEVPEQKVKVAFYKVGDSNLEFLEPTSEESPIAKFIAKRGEGIHHICFKVNDIYQALENLKNDGYRLIDEKPKIGAENKLVAFLHPKDANGVLIELSQSQG